ADAIVFTGGIGENDTNMRKLICKRLESAFGLKLNEELNDKTRGKEILLSTSDSKLQVWLIPTNEELMIARDTYRLIEK
ncbi:MAG: acetate kinase, partial [Longicatena sp.]